MIEVTADLSRLLFSSASTRSQTLPSASPSVSSVFLRCRRIEQIGKLCNIFCIVTDNTGSPPEPRPTLITDYELELDSPPCKPGAPTWSARATLEREIDEVLPYLNSMLEGADYDHGAKILVWKNEGRSFAFRSREIKAAPAHDRAEAEGLIEHAVNLVNDTWRERELLVPRYEARAKVNLMQIYRLLPRTNCGECGYSTCMAFAAALLEGGATLDCCAVVHRRENEDTLTALKRLFSFSPS
jgi:ArsR family metal-binding transcriptional regulator